MDSKSITSPKHVAPPFFPPNSLGEKVVKLLTWSDLTNSIIASTSGFLFLFLLKYGGYTLVSLVSYMILLQLALSFFYINGMRLWFNYGPLFLSYLPSTTQADIQPPNTNTSEETNERDVEYLTPDIFRSCATSIIDTINPILNLIVKIGRCKSNVTTLKVAAVVIATGWIGHCLDAMSFFLIVWITAFTLPNLYFTNKEMIDSYIHVLAQKIFRANQALNSSLGGEKSKTN